MSYRRIQKKPRHASLNPIIINNKIKQLHNNSSDNVNDNDSIKINLAVTLKRWNALECNSLELRLEPRLNQKHSGRGSQRSNFHLSRDGRKSNDAAWIIDSGKTFLWASAPMLFFLAMSSAEEVLRCSMRRFGMLNAGTCTLSVLYWWRRGRYLSGLESERSSSVNLFLWFLAESGTVSRTFEDLGEDAVRRTRRLISVVLTFNYPGRLVPR